MHATGTGGSGYFNISFTLRAIVDPVSVVLVGSFGTKTCTEFNDEGEERLFHRHPRRKTRLYSRQ